MGQRDIDLLPDLVVRPVVVEIVERRFVIHDEAFAAHGALDTAFVAVVLLDVLRAHFLRHVAQVLDEEHG